MSARFPMAVVVVGSPLTVTIEGASAVVAAEDFVGGLATDDRVQAAFLGDRLVVFARAGGAGGGVAILPERLQETAQIITFGDLNSFTNTGWYRGSSVTNAPTSEAYYFEVIHAEVNWVYQRATGFGPVGGNTGDSWQRWKSGGTWLAWEQIHVPGATAATANTLAKRGASARIKAADGVAADDVATMSQLPEAPYAEQVGTIAVTGTGASYAAGTITFQSGLFSTAPIVMLGSDSSTSGSAYVGSVKSVSSTSCTIWVSAAAGNNFSGTYTVPWRAVQMTSGAAAGYVGG